MVKFIEKTRELEAKEKWDHAFEVLKELRGEPRNSVCSVDILLLLRFAFLFGTFQEPNEVFTRMIKEYDKLTLILPRGKESRDKRQAKGLREAYENEVIPLSTRSRWLSLLDKEENVPYSLMSIRLLVQSLSSRDTAVGIELFHELFLNHFGVLGSVVFPRDILRIVVQGHSAQPRYMINANTGLLSLYLANGMYGYLEKMSKNKDWSKIDFHKEIGYLINSVILTKRNELAFPKHLLVA